MPLVHSISKDGTLRSYGYLDETISNVQPIVTTGLVLNYDINSTSTYPGTGTTIYDISGNNINGTLGNSPTYSSGTLTTNGTNSYILSSTNAGTLFSGNNSVTLEVWVKTVSDNGVVISELGSAAVSSGWHDSQMEIVSGNLKVSVWNGGGTYNLTIGAVTRNVWQHYVMTYNSSTTTLTGYINASTTNSTTGSRSAPYNNGNGLYYGLGSGDSTSLGDGSYLAATFGAFRVYNRALTLTEITQNFNAVRGSYGL